MLTQDEQDIIESFRAYKEWLAWFLGKHGVFRPEDLDRAAAEFYCPGLIDMSAGVWEAEKWIKVLKERQDGDIPF